MGVRGNDMQERAMLVRWLVAVALMAAAVVVGVVVAGFTVERLLAGWLWLPQGWLW